jgi:S1-C subfamily serine protease
MTRLRIVASICAAGFMGAIPASATTEVDPATIASISSGVVLVRATCHGARFLGSGFFVGESVVMTANHVVDGCSSASIHTTTGRWINARTWTGWLDGKRDLDVATLKLAEPADAEYIFSLRTRQIPIGGSIAVLGHPLGEGVSTINGRVIARAAGQHLVLRALGAQGASGGPVVDSIGDVVGLVNFAYGLPGALTGASVSDNIFAYDISSRWGGWKRTLCRSYPQGGITDCP